MTIMFAGYTIFGYHGYHIEADTLYALGSLAVVVVSVMIVNVLKD